MCVIFATDKGGKLPTYKDLKKGEETNPDGGGMAWIWNNRLFFRKGITADKMFELIKKYDIDASKTPVIFHFRIASAGGINDQLTHPFPINKTADLRLSGSLKGSVLFHNGHVSEWEKDFIDVCETNRPPKGAWSDSRLMAWEGYLSKGATLSESDEYLAILHHSGKLDLTGAYWDKHDGFVSSNNFWKMGLMVKGGTTNQSGYVFDGDENVNYGYDAWEEPVGRGYTPVHRYGNENWDNAYWKKREEIFSDECKYWNAKEKEIEENRAEQIELDRQKIFNLEGY